MNNPLGLGLFIMAASPDTQEELDTHSTSESEWRVDVMQRSEQPDPGMGRGLDPAHIAYLEIYHLRMEGTLARLAIWS